MNSRNIWEFLIKVAQGWKLGLHLLTVACIRIPGAQSAFNCSTSCRSLHGLREGMAYEWAKRWAWSWQNHNSLSLSISLALLHTHTHTTCAHTHMQLHFRLCWRIHTLSRIHTHLYRVQCKRQGGRKGQTNICAPSIIFVLMYLWSSCLHLFICSMILFLVLETSVFSVWFLD